MFTFAISSTEKNKPPLILNGFHYTVTESTGKITYWKCEDSRSMTCKDRVHTDLDYSLIRNQPSQHNHPPNVVNSKVRLFQQKIHTRAINTTENTQQVMNQCLRDVTDQIVACLPNFKHVKRTIQRQRKTFLQYDCSPGEHRILIFSFDKRLDILSECEEVIINGTFKVK
jgi:hypothetical protein